MQSRLAPGPIPAEAVSRMGAGALLFSIAVADLSLPFWTAGYRRRSAGEATVLALDPEAGGRALRERIGIVLQESALRLDFPVREGTDEDEAGLAVCPPLSRRTTAEARS